MTRNASRRSRTSRSTWAPASTRSRTTTAPFNLLRAGPHNLAVRCADADVVILHDADMVLPAAAPLEAAESPCRRTGWSSVSTGTGRCRRRGRGVRRRRPVRLEPIDEARRLRSAGCSPSRPVLVGGWRHGRAVRRLGLGTCAFAGAAGAALGPVLPCRRARWSLWHPHAGDPTNPDQQANSRLLAGGER